MITGLNASTDRFLTDLAAIGRRLEKAQNEMTSGKRIATASDDPSRIDALVSYNSQLSSANQVSTNLGQTKSEVDTAESAISSAVSLVENARVLATQAATGTATADTRASIADQAGSILQQLVAIANTTAAGRYVFAGDSDQAAPYSIDLTQESPVSLYSGTASTRQITDVTGTPFSVAKTAQELFDSLGQGQSVFSAINELRIALMNNDQSGINAAVQDITSAGTYLNSQHAFYGSVQKRVNGAIDSASKEITNLKGQISNLQDADMAQAALDLNSQIMAREAALQSEAKMPRTSLFDYLG